MRVKNKVRVSSKGQIVLPKLLRDRTGIREGDYVIVEELPDGLFLLGKDSESPLDAIVGGLRRAAKEKHFTRRDLEEAIREVRGKRPAE